jgi:hypothetical protein
MWDLHQCPSERKGEGVPVRRLRVPSHVPSHPQTTAKCGAFRLYPQGSANEATELSDFSVCTTWGVKGIDLFLLGVFRRRLKYPALKRAVREQQSLFDATVVLIEDKASGTQLIQELIEDGCHGVTRYQPT